jgi:hypothetical protein
MHINKTTVVILLAVILAVTAISQSTLRLPVWDGRQYTFPRLGSGFVVANGTISVTPSEVPQRKYGQILPFDASQSAWVLPASATNIVVFVNGLRYTSGVDYSATTTTGAVFIRALGTNMTAADVVVVDYD